MLIIVAMLTIPDFTLRAEYASGTLPILIDTIVSMVRILYIRTNTGLRTNIASGSDNFTYLH